jgi:hypothetical protein
MNDFPVKDLGAYGIFVLLFIKYMIEFTKAMKSNKNESGGFEQNVRDTKGIALETRNVSVDTNDKVKTLHSLYTKTTQDGIPMGYFPHSIVEDQKEITKSMEQTAIYMKAVADSVERLEKKGD